MTQGERVKEVRKELGLTLEKFGEKIGVTKTAISRIEKGERGCTEQMTKAICREFSVDYIWLTTGDGEMFVESDDDIMETIDRIMAGENEFHKKLIKWCATSFNEDDLRMLERKIDEFVAEFSKKD
ncbi:MAG: helix-turn-helix transcriptional regulator [Eubacteriales bacterium]|nr:helix-turn-helix transcriptional regulator [Eubacteriales bacterium]